MTEFPLDFGPSLSCLTALIFTQTHCVLVRTVCEVLHESWSLIVIALTALIAVSVSKVGTIPLTLVAIRLIVDQGIISIDGTPSVATARIGESIVILSQLIEETTILATGVIEEWVVTETAIAIVEPRIVPG